MSNQDWIVTAIAAFGGLTGLAAILNSFWSRKKVKSEAADIVTRSTELLLIPLNERIEQQTAEIDRLKKANADQAQTFERAMTNQRQTFAMDMLKQKQTFDGELLSQKLEFEKQTAVLRAQTHSLQTDNESLRKNNRELHLEIAELRAGLKLLTVQLLSLDKTPLYKPPERPEGDDKP